MIYLLVNNEIVDSKNVDFKSIDNSSNMFFLDIVNSRVKDAEDYKIVFSANDKNIMRIYTYVHYFDRVNNKFANILYKSANSMSKNLHRLISNYEIKKRMNKLNKINV